MRRRPHILVAVFFFFPFSVAFDPCADFDRTKCDSVAECFSDRRQIAECRCPQGFVDLSPNATLPGRRCQKIAFKKTPNAECSVNDPLTCDLRKHEVCLFVEGRYRCGCPIGYDRLADDRCLAINECRTPKLNDCAPEAECIDLDVGFECRCRSGYVDTSGDPKRLGRKCSAKVNECLDPQRFGVDCDEMSHCVDMDEGFVCRCLPGFVDVSAHFAKAPGRRCIEEINECADSTLNDCSQNAECEDIIDGYVCKCKDGFIDSSPDSVRFPGRSCSQPSSASRPPHSFPSMADQCDPNSAHACRPNELCVRRNSSFVCECAPWAFRFRDGSCRQQSACDGGHADCDSNALCINSFDSFQCQCRSGFFDASPDVERKPGRLCRQLINECAIGSHNCSPFAECIDEIDGFSCFCEKGYVDASARYSLPPGRQCARAANECADKRLNTCDENADCIDTPDSYSCQCYEGFVDVSSSANLLPGRICTVQTTCPQQKTDLVFLIDGSGSIGSHVFVNEVLRFLREFVDLFDVGHEKTRVGLIQYSDQIRHEFDLDAFGDKLSVQKAIGETEYLTGLTRTGAAIKHMITEGFSERRGARAQSPEISRVAIVITDGRSQDNVTEPAREALSVANVTMFAVGVTDHILASELESIAGSPNRWFFVDRFKDLDTRLRSLIQKLACPSPERNANTAAKCEVGTQTGCNRELNEICISANGASRCVCPPSFERHPLTHACGSPQCNPEVPTSCPVGEICSRTPFGTHRCVCAPNLGREQKTGICVPLNRTALRSPNCPPGFELNIRTNKCLQSGTCDPNDENPCDWRKREKCLLHPSGDFHSCRCESSQQRHPVTDICLSNECQTGENECDPMAVCVDTDESYLCSCPPGFLDVSVEPAIRPGRRCIQQVDECSMGTHNCSKDAVCVDTADSYECRCRKGFVDLSSNIRREAGRICRKEFDECSTPGMNDCHPEALCEDTADSFKCVCRNGFADIDELRHPGRNCIKGNVNECKSPMLNRCSQNAVCIDEPNGYRCECKNNFVDKSPDGTFGFVCEPPEAPKHACDDPSTNDCAPNADCRPNGAAFSCHCRENFLDKSVDPLRHSGRVCIPRESICRDPQRNDCHPQAVCTESKTNGTEFSCRCRDGYADRSPQTDRKGRICVELVNECLDRTLNDCDSIAICEDLEEGFRCLCPLSTVDQSPDSKRPGRLCKETINECSIPRLNNCSRFADCTDRLDGYECKCKNGYHDDFPSQRGTVCSYIINECESPTLNDCHRNADCLDKPGGYECKCRQPFEDQSPDPKRPGRLCLFDECSSNRTNRCDKNADCRDTADGFVCSCRRGFFDNSPNPIETGRVCLEYNEKSNAIPMASPNDGEILCGKVFCSLGLREVCVDGFHCECRPSESRASNDAVCVSVRRTPLSLRILSDGEKILRFSSAFAHPDNLPYSELAEKFRFAVGKILGSSPNGSDYVNTEIDLITHPKTLNSSWSDGLLVNFTVMTSAAAVPDKCVLWEKLLESTILHNGYLGAESSLRIAEDSELLGPCAPPPNFCHGKLCNTELGEVCQNGECLIDYCSDVRFCPQNSSCLNTPTNAECQCDDGFVDIRMSKRASDSFCLKERDVDECRLGIHNCSVVAECTDLPIGYSCRCPREYVDGNPEVPGRVCAALLCDLCNGHGDCIPEGGNITCSCSDGYTGEFCELESSSLPFFVLIALALLFLLLTLCLLLYLFSKCRCFRRVVPWAELSTGLSDNTSELYGIAIPRAKLKNDNVSVKSADSDFTVRQEIDRVVITDVFRTEHDDGDNHSFHEFIRTESRLQNPQIERRESFSEFANSQRFGDYPFTEDNRSVESLEISERGYEYPHNRPPSSLRPHW